VLAVFEAATGAVNAGLDVQRQLTAAMGDAPPDRCLRFRIGVHLGDVFEKPDGTVQGRVSARFEDIGEQAVKNIAQPVRVFRLHPGEGSAAGVSATVTGTPPARRRRWLAARTGSTDPRRYFRPRDSGGQEC
jgi:adenylate cyclase